jgi:hypothetical protein
MVEGIHALHILSGFRSTCSSYYIILRSHWFIALIDAQVVLLAFNHLTFVQLSVSGLFCKAIPSSYDMQPPPIRTLSTSEALNLLSRGLGSIYFVPTGERPIPVLNTEEDPDILSCPFKSHGPAQVPAESLPQTRLSTKVMRTKRKPTTRRDPNKGPPRPSNAFMLYRKAKQVSPPYPGPR